MLQYRSKQSSGYLLKNKVNSGQKNDSSTVVHSEQSSSSYFLCGKDAWLHSFTIGPHCFTSLNCNALQHLTFLRHAQHRVFLRTKEASYSEYLIQ